MIPKIIHYCWFGHGEKSKLAERCIASWKKYCPEFEFIEWNEENFDVTSHPYAKYCYDNKKWAFLSDFVRLEVVYKYGGVYFDTDVELIKSPKELLKYDAFFGFENETNVSTGIGFGAIPENKEVYAMCQQYYELKQNERDEFPIIPCPKLNTEALLPMGLDLNGRTQKLDNGKVIVLGIDYLNPYDDPTGRLNRTENTISIHWFSKSWLDKKTILRSKLTRPFHRIFGKDCFAWLKK